MLRRIEQSDPRTTRRLLRFAATVTATACLVAAASVPAVASTATATALPYALTAVSAASADDAWAVGNSFDGNDYPTAHIVHWNGRVWAESELPKLCCNVAFTELLSVNAQSKTNVWAVGDYATPSFQGRLLILHWNGNRWSQLPGPLASTTNAALFGVSADSSTDAWAVGQIYLSDGIQTQPLTLHWDGKRWSRVLSGGAGDVFLTSVAALGPHNAWTAGSHNGGAALVAHWNGTTWVRLPNPSPRFSGLSGIAGLSGSDLWAVGSYNDSSGNTLTLTEHWNGSSWTRTPSPNDATSDFAFNALNAVDATASNDVWAVGTSLQGALTLHWNGTKWTNVPLGLNIDNPTLNGVSALTPSNVWAVGYTTNSNAVSTALILHWNGKTWTRT